MDDSLEKPNPLLRQNSNREADDEGSSGDEYDGPDWTKLSLPGIARPVIPKRGEKDFEPAPGGGSGLQQHVLNQARNAMFDALRGPRSSSSKSISYGVWCPNLARVHVTLARGIHFTVMGHSTPRSQPHDSTKLQKRLELLPEEAIYLIERGTLFCWKQIDLVLDGTLVGMEDVQGAPMSVQHAYSEMIGQEGLSLEKYQVFAHLKRLGYIVTRSDPPSPAYPIPPPLTRTTQRRSFFHRLYALISRWASQVLSPLLLGINWWRPLRFRFCFQPVNRYASLFRSLRFIPTPQISIPDPPPSSPYRFFFNVYKPSTQFRKTAPPSPDFHVVVVNAQTTPMPSYNELHALFQVLPELPPPLPRQRQPATVKPAPQPTAVVAGCTPSSGDGACYLRPIFPWLFRFFPPPPGQDVRPSPPTRRPNPFMALKAGKRTVVVAAVDIGNISFFRFSEGAFHEWPMV